MTKSFSLVIISAVLLTTLWGVAAQGTSGVGTLENYHQTTDQGDNLLLEVFFNLVDGSGQVLTETELQSVGITLQNGENYEVETTQPTTPFYIALVLDASGSMIPAERDMRAAAKEGVTNAPENAQFAVISFNDQITVLQDFNSDENLTAGAIDAVKAVNGRGTCLYDATAQAIELMAQRPPGRRAIIVFTDGVDEISPGGPPCSTNTRDGVINAARQPTSRVPLYTIGMETENAGGNPQDLALMAQSTGGITAFGGQGDLSALFGKIMAALSSQWYARAEIYPDAGVQPAVITPILDGGLTADPAQIEINSPKDYIIPQTAEVNVKFFTFNPATETLQIDLEVLNLSTAAELEVKVRSETGTDLKPPEQFPAQTSTLNILLPNLQAGKYTATITGVFPDGTPLLPAPIEREWEITLEREVEVPPPTITILGVVPAETSLNASVTYTNSEQIASLGLLILSGGNIVKQAEGIQPVKALSMPLDAPLAAGDYELSIMAYGSGGEQLLGQQVTYGFNIKGCEAPIISVLGDGATFSKDEVRIPLTTSNIECVDRLEVSVIREDNNQTVIEPFSVEADAAQTSFSSEDLEGNRSYLVKVTPYDKDGRAIIQSAPTGKFTMQAKSQLPTILMAMGLAILVVAAGGGIYTVVNNQRKKRNKPISYVDSHEARAQGTLFMNNLHQQPEMQTFAGSMPPKDGTPMDVKGSPLPYRPAIPSPAPKDQQQGTLVLNEYALDLDTRARAPQAFLTVIQARTEPTDLQVSNPNFDLQSKRIKFAMRFIVGREYCDLNFTKDKSVSGTHLEITYRENRGGYIAKVIRSSYGTIIDGQPLAQNQEKLLEVGRDIEIRLGQTVVLSFRTDQR